MNEATMAALETVSRVLLRCWIMGFALMLVWLAAMLLGGDSIYALHGAWFGLERHEMAVIFYSSLALLKLLVLTFFFIPWLSIRLVLRRDRAMDPTGANSSRVILGLTLLVVPLASGSSAAAAETNPPNIVILLADDLGFSDLGCYGAEIETPHLDRLASEGLRFTQFYNTARCWPTRAALLTGFYAQQVRRDALPGLVSGSRGARPPWGRLLPVLLEPAGYRSYHSGKWHVDGPVLAGGFHRSYSLNDHDRLFGPRQHTLDDRPLPPVDPASGYYSTTAIVDWAIEFLREHVAKHPERPFFQYVAFNAPHFPLQAPASDIEKYRNRYSAGWDVVREQRWQRQLAGGLLSGKLTEADRSTVPPWNLSTALLREQIDPHEFGPTGPWNGLSEPERRFQSTKMAIHAAMIDRVDQEVGRLLEQLRSMPRAENTIVMFLSDNGASAEQINRGDRHDPAAPLGSGGSYLGLGPGWSATANAPFRLHKHWVHEGGIATPLIVHWPAGLAARGALRHTPGHVIDLVPTLLSLAGLSESTKPLAGQPPFAGRNLRPIFERDQDLGREELWWFHDGNKALRVGDWKLVSRGHEAPWELYDLSRDRGEAHDRAGEQPRRVAEMARRWEAKLAEFKEQATRDLP